MARLYTDGAESGDALRIIAESQPGWVTASATQKRSGNYSYYNNNNDYAIFHIISPAITEFYARQAWYFGGTNETTYRELFQWFNGTTKIGGLQVKAGPLGEYKAIVGESTVVATSSVINWSTSAWHVIEIHVKIHATTGEIEVKFDGTTVLTYSGNTATAGSQMDRARYYFPPGSSNAVYLDDIAFNDTSGAADNSWCGDGGVLAAIVPDGAGNYTDLIASAGSAYDCVDEIPQNGDTDYGYESTINKKSTYTMSAVATPPTGASIARVWVEVAAKESAADGDKIATFLRSGGTDAQGSDQVLTIAYARYVSAEYLTDPADAAAWTTTKVNALEAGAIVR